MKWTTRIKETDTTPHLRDPIHWYEAILTYPKVEWAIIGKGWSKKEAIKHAKAQITNSLITLSEEQRNAEVLREV